MKTVLKLLLFVGLVWPSFGAQPPVVRNGWTTNAEAQLPIRVYSPTYAYLGAAIVPNFRVPSSDTFFMGTLAGLADDGSANDSLGFGIASLSVCSNGLGNVGFGGNTLADLTNASGILGLGYHNSAFGYQAGNGIDCGVDGIYIGRQTGPLHGGYYNICIGALATYENLKTNTVSIGYNASSTGDNIFVLGDTNMDRYVFRGQTYTFPPVRGTNEYLFIGTGGQLYWTNVVSFTTNISGDSFVTNLTVYSNAYFYSTAYINNNYTTNLTVVSNAYFNETIYVNNTFITNLTVVSNAYFPKHAYISNLYATNIFIESSQFGTNTITEANPLFVDFNTNTYQFMDATGDVEVHTTNRIAKTGIRFCTVFVRNTAATNITLTFDTNWINFVGNSLLITNGKWGVFTLGLKGTNEVDVIASHETQGN